MGNENACGLDHRLPCSVDVECPYDSPAEVRDARLRKLVYQWRERAENNRNVGQRHDANQIEQCAGELEEVINE